MADMASLDEVSWAWKELSEVTDADRIIPVTYVNSSAAIKAFVGERQGSVCTSSNAERVLTWALEQGEKVFFFPDDVSPRSSVSRRSPSYFASGLHQRPGSLGPQHKIHTLPPPKIHTQNRYQITVTNAH